METLTAVFVALFGAAWGSFLNVVIHRVPRRMSIVRPPSACPGCGKRIRAIDNVPVFSYLRLGGKCRWCGARIPVFYLLVEILTPAALVLLYLKLGLTPAFFAAAIFASALIVLGFVDFFHQILPDAVTFPGTALALLYALIRPDLRLLDAAFGLLLGAGFLLLVYGAYYLLRKAEGLGLGDVILMAMVGAFLGWRKAALTLILASFAGAFVGIGLIVARGKSWKHALPFGTFIAPAAYVALVWGDALIAAYLGLFLRE